MDAETYETTQHQLGLLAGMVAELPLEDFLAAIDRADTLGPMIDPTLWIRGQETMHQIEALARGALAFKQAALKVRGQVAPPSGGKG